MTPRTVLVVDDESFVRDSLLALLEAEGCRTLGAATGHEALGILARERVDLVATDLQMPDGDGMELLEEVRATDPDLPVLVLTGVGTVPDAVRAMKAGGRGLHPEAGRPRPVRASRHACDRPPPTPFRGPSPPPRGPRPAGSGGDGRRLSGDA